MVFTSVPLVKELIERTTTRSGLRVSVDIIDKVSEVGRKAAEHLRSSLQITVPLCTHQLGQPVAFFGGVSNGFLGERLMSLLQVEGIATDCVVRLDAPTTLSLVGLDASGVPSYSFHGEACADRLVPLSALERVPATAKALHFGSYAMVVEPVAQTLRTLIEREHGRALISYDPNVRLTIEPGLSTWREMLNWMVPPHHAAEDQRRRHRTAGT